MKMDWVQAVGQLLKMFVNTHCQWVIATKCVWETAETKGGTTCAH